MHLQFVKVDQRKVRASRKIEKEKDQYWLKDIFLSKY